MVDKDVGGDEDLEAGVLEKGRGVVGLRLGKDRMQNKEIDGRVQSRDWVF